MRAPGHRFWRLLLRVLPADLRAEYGAELLAVTLERLHAERACGPLARWRRFAATLSDFASTGLRMRAAARRRSRLDPSPHRTLDTMLQDLRSAVRLLLHRPGFTAAVLVTLALGIGANTLIYSTVDTVILNPFDMPDPDRVLAVGTEFPRLDQDLNFFETLSGPEYADVQEQVRSIEVLAGFDLGNRQIMGSDTPTNLFTGFWWADPLPVIGVQTLLGRSFSPDELRTGAAVALISERVWRSRFAADPQIVGREIRINDRPYVLIGVFPASVNIYGTDLWTILPFAPQEMPRGRRQFNIIARTAEGFGLREVNTELETLSRRIESEYGDELSEYGGWRLRAMTWTGAQVRTLRPVALALLGTVALVLLLVCANVASLLLSNAAHRQREMAVRAALGAGRSRLVRQVLSESAVLALLGAALGVGLAYLGLQWMQANLPSQLLPTTRPLALNARALAFTGVVSMLAGVLFGMAPALSAARTDLQGTLAQSGGGSGTGRARRRLYDALVGIEVALAVVLLTAAGLFLTSLWRLQSLDPGIDADNVMTMRLTLPWERYEGAAITDFFEQLGNRVAALPGVRATASASQFPPLGFGRASFSFPEQVVENDSEMMVSLITIASHDYFETLGIPLMGGRTWGEETRAGTPPAAVVNESFAARYLDGAALGRRVVLGRPDDPGALVFEVIGVVGDTRNTGLQSPPAPELYASLRQADGINNQLFLLVRTEGDPTTILPSIRTTVAAMDPDQPIYSLATLEDRMASGYATEALAMRLLGAFALLAVVLAGTGIFGVVAFAVQRRAREIGLRVALGAEGAQVSRLVVRQAVTPILVGGAFGMVGAVFVGLSLTGLLEEIQPFEPSALGGVVLALAAIGLLAAWLPARRASGIDPVCSLRAE